MLTQCPGCQTVFRVTGAILKIAHGQVRCGRCNTQFDALEHMLPDDLEDQLQTVAQEEPPKSEQIVVEEPPAHEEITLEGKRIEISGVYRVLDETDPEHPHTQTIVEEFEFNDGELESALPEEVESPEEIEPEIEPSEVADEPSAASEVSGLQATREALAAAQEEIRAESTPFFAAPEPSADSFRVWWGVASAALALLFCIQVIHHYRQDLARNPKVGPLLISTYAALGLQLTPNWDLHAYDVQQWGIVSDPNAPGTLRVRAGITNKGAFAQPYPLLKLVLEDRWGGEIGSREFEPREYLPATTAADRMLAPHQAANAEIDIVDPGEDAVGFHLDVCVHRGNGIACASEQSAAG